MKLFFRFLTLIMVFGFIMIFTMHAQAAVRLISFDAIAYLQNQTITLVWESDPKWDFTGFHKLQSLSEDTGFMPQKDEFGNPQYVPAIGEGGVVAQYFYDDTTVTSSVTAGTQTPTASKTPLPSTPTRTKTTKPTVTITRTSSPFRVVTFTSRPRPTSTLTDTPTTTSTPTISPTVTTTLAPLPSLTLLFPARTPTPTATPSPTPSPSPVPPTPTPTPTPENHIPLRVSFLSVLILLLWLALAGFLFTYLRRISR